MSEQITQQRVGHEGRHDEVGKFGNADRPAAAERFDEVSRLLLVALLSEADQDLLT